MEKSDTRERRERKKKQDTEIFEMGDVVTKACSNETKNNCVYKKSSVTSVQNVKSCGSYIYTYIYEREHFIAAGLLLWLYRHTHTDRVR